MNEREKATVALLNGVIKEVYDRVQFDFDKTMELMNETSNFAERLLKKYPDARYYRLFHVLSFSTVSNVEFEKFDYPGEDSVEIFILNLSRRYLH